MIRAALITAAGRSTRMGGGTKKEYRLINGIPILEKIVSLFSESSLFSRVVVTCPAGEMSAFEEILAGYRDETLIICEGGDTRQDSVRQGLLRLAAEPGFDNPEAVVLIHDGARPWLTIELINAILKDLEQHPAVLPVVPSVNAMKTIDGDGNIRQHLPRPTTVAAQTPQAFRLQNILEAHQKALADNRSDFIDDTEIFQLYSGPVHTIPGDPANTKITYPADISDTNPASSSHGGPTT